MDYFERVQNAIEFIEQNLQEEIKITDIAKEACFSIFHFQRLFHAISGFSVQEYIRKRRLSNAAVLLRETNKSILEIAVTYQYGSQEAFTRAFESYFGLTPAKFRKTVTKIHHQEKINFLNYRKNIKGDLKMDKPEIVTLEKINIIGYEYKISMEEERYFEEVPKYYDDFGMNEYYLKIPNRIASAFAYGIACNNFTKDSNQTSFIIGEVVQHRVEELDEGFMNYEIPGGQYAVFKVCGSVDTAQNTRRYIYGTWLPNSNYEWREGPDFEVIDVCNPPFPGGINMKIYIPVK